MDVMMSETLDLLVLLLPHIGPNLLALVRFGRVRLGW